MKPNVKLYNLIAHLIEDLIDYGKDIQDILATLSFYGISRKDAIDYGWIPERDKEDI